MNTSCNFGVYYASEAYSTDGKIMGRQSTGKAFMRGLARTWPTGPLVGVGQGVTAARAMLKQLQTDGFTGPLRWAEIPDWAAMQTLGAVYYPSPAAKDFCYSRNAYRPDAVSFMGVTFTLSSAGAMDQVAELVLPPFQAWDAMICISQAALDFTLQMHTEVKAWWSAQTGATRFNAPQLPVIPLGIDAPSFAPDENARRSARQALDVAAEEVVFLFSGRLSFHAKANPVPMYQAMELTAKHAKVVCVEAGIFPNQAIADGFAAARAALAPSVRFVSVDGRNEAQYRQAWQCADVFVSLSDNIQETFGLTPVEAMAAGLPVIVSDWNGYKETVRDGIDGYRIASVLPPGGTGSDLAMRHALAIDTYDFYIGRTSLATVIDPVALGAACVRLATDPLLRQRMGASGLARAQSVFDWPQVLPRYVQLAQELAAIRRAAGAQTPQPWVQRADPFARFANFSSETLQGNWTVQALPDAKARLQDLLSLAMANYALDGSLLPRELLIALLENAAQGGRQSVNALLLAAGASSPVGVRCLMYLWKFGLLDVRR